MKLTKSQLKQIIKEEIQLLNEGGTRGSLIDVREQFQDWFDDLINAVTSQNFSRGNEGHSQGEEIAKEVRKFAAKFDSMLKKYKQSETMWFRRIL